MKITSIEQQKRRKERYSIFIDNKYTFSLEDIDLAKLNLVVGLEVSDEDLEFYIHTYEYSKARDRALTYISFKMRTRLQVENRLKDLGYSSEIIDKVLNELTNLKYIDDRSYAEMYIKEKSKFRPSGKRLLRLELRNKGLKDDLISEKLENSEIDEYQMAKNLIDKKSSHLKVLDKKELHKLYSMLIRKGFSNSTALQVLKEFEKSWNSL